MLAGKTPNQFKAFNKEQKRNILRSYGYGVPNLEKALYSAGNSLTLIAEESIKPYKLVGTRITYDEIHLYELPWPTHILQNDLSDVDVRLNITLSYFINPNPGSRNYSSQFSYQSHGLRFNVIRPDEDLDDFKARINKNDREAGATGFNGEPWSIGVQNRNKGSIHRDFWMSSGADMATRNYIAIYPVGGWYKLRKKLEMYNSSVQYSLVVTIDTPEVDIDIYIYILQWPTLLKLKFL